MHEIEDRKYSDYPVDGMYGNYGGSYVPEILIPALEELENSYKELMNDKSFLQEIQWYNNHYGGRPTPLYLAKRLTKMIGGAKIYLKREDLMHGGAHKFNNTMGQGLLAKSMGKSRIIAETGAGQHGVSVAMIGAVLGIETLVYMGEVDIKRQKPNVQRMELLGAKVIPVKSGSRTLKDAVNEAMREWVRSVETTHYLIGSVVGPHPFPQIVRDFQSVIGTEIREQLLKQEGTELPDAIAACVGGGSNAAGAFFPFIDDHSVKLYGAEAGGRGTDHGEHCGSLTKGSIGIFHGSKQFMLQNKVGNVMKTHSISAGLDYPGVGPEHSFWKEISRVSYEMITDQEALDSFFQLSKLEGIIPALESSHAIALGMKIAREMTSEEILVINLSGRGDKDVPTILENQSVEEKGKDE